MMVAGGEHDILVKDESCLEEVKVLQEVEYLLLVVELHAQG